MKRILLENLVQEVHQVVGLMQRYHWNFQLIIIASIDCCCCCCCYWIQCCDGWHSIKAQRCQILPNASARRPSSNENDRNVGGGGGEGGGGGGRNGGFLDAINTVPSVGETEETAFILNR